MMVPEGPEGEPFLILYRRCKSTLENIDKMKNAPYRALATNGVAISISNPDWGMEGKRGKSMKCTERVPSQSTGF